MKALNVQTVDVCPWALREGIVLHYLQTMHNESFDLPLRPLDGLVGRESGPGPRGTTELSPVAPAPAGQ